MSERPEGMSVSSSVKLGIVQMSMGADKRTNLAKAVKMVAEAAAGGADVVCLPELFSSTYFPQREGERVSPEPVPGPTSRALAKAAESSEVLLVGGSILEKAGNRERHELLDKIEQFVNQKS